MLKENGSSVTPKWVVRKYFKKYGLRFSDFYDVTPFEPDWNKWDFQNAFETDMPTKNLFLNCSFWISQ